jgi:hypothetical protein
MWGDGSKRRVGRVKLAMTHHEYFLNMLESHF